MDPHSTFTRRRLLALAGAAAALPAGAAFAADEWPKVVARMQENMEWMNRVVGSQPSPGEPQLRVEEINAFLRKYARR